MNELTTDITTPDGARLHVRVWQGDAPGLDNERTLLLLHGWPNNGRTWKPLAEALLLGGGVRLVAPDLKGFGDSDKPATGYTCEQFADDVLAVAGALSLNDYVLVGHSMSGKIAQLVASRRPAGLAGLVLVAPTPLVTPPTPEEKKAAQRAWCGDRQKVEAFFAGLTAHPLAASDLASLVDDGLRAAPQAWNGWIDAMRDAPYPETAARIAVPTLVVAGGRDAARDEETLRRDVAGQIPGAQFAALPGSGHLPHLEEPAALAALLLNFLDTLPA